MKKQNVTHMEVIFNRTINQGPHRQEGHTHIGEKETGEKEKRKDRGKRQ